MEIRKLNSLRAIATLIVVVSHYSNITNIWGGKAGIGAGQLGVMLFFLLSGFLISYLYLEKPFTRDAAYSYMVYRLARVMPLFLIVVILSYILQQAGVTGVLYDIGGEKVLFSHITLLFGTSVLWTIPPEIQFYTIFILFWWLWQQHPRLLFIPLCLLMIIAWMKFPRYSGEFYGIPWKITLLQMLPFFFTGVFAGLLYNNWRAPQRFISRGYLLLLLFIPLLFPQIYTALNGKAKIEYGDIALLWQDARMLLLFGIIFFVIIFLVPDNCKILANKTGDFFGKISYSVYLLHMPILIQLQEPAKQHPQLLLPVFLGLTTILAYLSYTIIERPLRMMIRTYWDRSRKRQGSIKK